VGQNADEAAKTDIIYLFKNSRRNNDYVDVLSCFSSTGGSKQSSASRKTGDKVQRRLGNCL